MLPNKFRIIWQSGFREEDLKKSANQKEELPMAAMFVDGSGQNDQSLETTDAKWWQKLTLHLTRWAKKYIILTLGTFTPSNVQILQDF